MKLMQHRYPSIARLEIELRQLESVAPPTRPCEFISPQYPFDLVNLFFVLTLPLDLMFSVYRREYFGSAS